MQPRRDIDDYCYKGNRKLKEAVLPPNYFLLPWRALVHTAIKTVQP